LQTVPDEDKEEYMNKIKEISAMRFRLYDSIKHNYLLYATQLKNTDRVLKEQTQAMSIVNKELEDIEKNKLKMQNELLKKNKEVQINEYYGLYYQSHAAIFKYIIVGCLIIIFIILLKKNYILPGSLSMALIALIVFIISVLIMKKVWNLYWRNSNNFNEYDWYFEKP
jgi:hypothetical protein